MLRSLCLSVLVFLAVASIPVSAKANLVKLPQYSSAKQWSLAHTPDDERPGQASGTAPQAAESVAPAANAVVADAVIAAPVAQNQNSAPVPAQGTATESVVAAEAGASPAPVQVLEQTTTQLAMQPADGTAKPADQPAVQNLAADQPQSQPQPPQAASLQAAAPVVVPPPGPATLTAKEPDGPSAAVEAAMKANLAQTSEDEDDDDDFSIAPSIKNKADTVKPAGKPLKTAKKKQSSVPKNDLAAVQPQDALRADPVAMNDAQQVKPSAVQPAATAQIAPSKADIPNAMTASTQSTEAKVSPAPKTEPLTASAAEPAPALVQQPAMKPVETPVVAAAAQQPSADNTAQFARAPAPPAAPSKLTATQVAETSPSSAGYTFGPGDKLRVTVYGEQELSGEFQADGQGKISMPLIGEINVNALTIPQVADSIETRLREGYLRDPKVNIDVMNYRPFFILGEVLKPGSYPFVSGLTVVNAVAMAGGYSYRADKDAATIVRAGDSQKKEQKIGETGLVMPGDVVRVPERFF